MKKGNYGIVITRFAPSPTGYLHIGGARTALFNYLFARHHHGKFLLRIEDTDRERSTEESTKGIFEGLKWLGIEWDEEPYYQSRRLAIYNEYLDILIKNKKVYPCFCTEEELEERRKSALAQGKKPKYDGHCRNLKTLFDKPFVMRFKMPQTGTIKVSDLIKGEIFFDNSELDDFILMRSDGCPTYNFAVVVDDICMGITHIIRGDDHLNNTPRQIHLYEALGYKPPKFAHVPLILGKDKSRLSKRHGATSVLAYRDMGYLPQAMVNFLVRIGWSYGNQEIFSIKELIEKFSLENVGRSAGVFNENKLIWLNSFYIRNSDNTTLLKLLIPFLEKKGFFVKEITQLERIISILKERSKTLVEMADAAEIFFREPVNYDQKAIERFWSKETSHILNYLIDQIRLMESFDSNSIESLFFRIQREKNIKLILIAQSVRLALTGKTVSPGIFEVMEILGKDEVIKRLKNAVFYIENKI